MVVAAVLKIDNSVVGLVMREEWSMRHWMKDSFGCYYRTVTERGAITSHVGDSGSKFIYIGNGYTNIPRVRRVWFNVSILNLTDLPLLLYMICILMCILMGEITIIAMMPWVIGNRTLQKTWKENIDHCIDRCMSMCPQYSDRDNPKILSEEHAQMPFTTQLLFILHSNPK